MFTEKNSLHDIANHPLLKDIGPYIVTHKDWSQDPNWDLPLEVAYPDGGCYYGSILPGFNRLLEERENGECFFQIYSEEEIAEDPAKGEVHLLFFASDAPEAKENPYIFVCPGGGFTNVWNIHEGFAVANYFSKIGFNAVSLTYRVEEKGLMPKPLEDYAKALEFIRDHNEIFGFAWDRYITTGFSAGGTLITQWGTEIHGWKKYGMPKPLCMFPVYPPISWKLMLADGGRDDYAMGTLGMTLKEAAESEWNTDEHLENYPPCYIVCTEDDDMVNPEHSRILKRELDKLGIPAELEIGKFGHHGFAVGDCSDCKGWMDRAAAFYKNLGK